MGEVYRARDTRLNRDVALKILPDAFALDPERLARFQREAQILATLNHPHIAGIYGLEESGGVRFLALEFVDGGTLAARLAAGPMPIDDALAMALEILDAIEAAHDRGIVHRDLKPANIALTSDCRVKILDFGLAKDLGATGATSSPGATNSPTLTLGATQAGVILGTAAYMSPEQAKGRPADKRSDVWAFGCVLFEMLSGRRAFEAEDVSDTLAAVLRGVPDWSVLPPGTPARVRDVLERCLIRDRKARIPDLSVARYFLTAAGSPSSASRQDRQPTSPRASGALVAAAVAIARNRGSPHLDRDTAVGRPATGRAAAGRAPGRHLLRCESVRA
jgi:serine/threonine-protein kinase